MDGENNGNPYEQMDDLGGFYHPLFLETPIYILYIHLYTCGYADITRTYIKITYMQAGG